MPRTLVAAMIAATLATQAVAKDCQVYRAEGEYAPPPWSRDDCPSTCVVTFNGGGLINQFVESAIEVKQDRRRLVIDGECYSACTIAADIARPRVCITANASFKFHKGYEPDENNRIRRLDLRSQYSWDIRRWIMAQGGLPGKDACDDSYLTMNFREATRYFPVCGSED